MKKQILIVMLLIFFTGCISLNKGYRSFYKQVSPINYEQTKIGEVDVFNYDGLAIEDVYNLLYKGDFEIIGRSDFRGGYEKAGYGLKILASQKGADLVLTSISNEKATPYTYSYSTPTSQTSYVTNASGQNLGTITSYGYTNQTETGTAYTYEHRSIFLKNKKGIPKYWNQTEKDYIAKGVSKYDGIWSSNNNIKLKIYKTGNAVIGVLAERYQSLSLSERSCEKGEIKFIFDLKTLQGLWFMNDKTPMPTKLEMDENNYLSIKIPTDQFPIKLARLSDTNEVKVITDK